MGGVKDSKKIKMGNVNGREENEGNIPSGVEGVDGIDSGGVQDIMAVHQVDGEFMGQSPPSSPRASRSPLMFRPEVSLLTFLVLEMWGGGVVLYLFCFVLLFFIFFWLY